MSWSSEVCFSDLKPGDSAEILGYHEGNHKYQAKLLAMGLVRGVTIKVLQAAPLGDPVKIQVLSYRLSLRKKEANILKIRRAESA
ncbi:MAG: ferrous iron transport protein A [Fibrobacter sp.]|jgi:ferrous iron transport protein A|nr:ferrous iron transport protein A [Fibrobacter sp.]